MEKFVDKKTSISLKGITKKQLTDLGHKGMSYDDIISDLYHQRNVFMIHSLCRGKHYDEIPSDLEEYCKGIFFQMKFQTVPPYFDGGLNGDNTWKEWDSFEECLHYACEMATDEDLVGSSATQGDRKLSLGEVVTNVYCLMNNISAPTWGNGAMRNPFAL